MVNFATQPKPKVLHFIPSIGGGGAENFLRQLARGMAQRGEWDSVIVVVKVAPHEAFAEELRALGITVHDMNSSALLKPNVWLQLRRLIQQEHPDVIQTWMHHADFMGGIAARSAGYHQVLWGVRATEVHRNPGDSDLKTWLFHKALGLSSRLLPRKILSNSQSAVSVHQRMGFPAQRMVVIPNGVDTGRFQPNPETRAAVRAELGVPEGSPVIGFVGRFHPVKDLPTFFRAALELQQQRPDTHFLLCGGTAPELQAAAAECFAAMPKPAQVHFVPFGNSTQRYYPAMDLFSLTSSSEAFPNVVLEAMASALPCVTTAAGDCGVMLQDLGSVVRCGDAAALAKAWSEMLSHSTAELQAIGQRGRERVLERYTPERALLSFQEQYAACLSA
jgi:glycosyltransferase involved in cell wall biosynthesis